MKKIAVLVDAACNLPPELMAMHDIIVVPFHIATKHGHVIDNHSAADIDAWYEKHLRNKSDDYARSVPLHTEELEAFFLEKIVLQYDKAVFLTITAARSKMLKNISDAWFGISSKSFKLRREHNIKAGFELEIVDSGSLGPGQGLLAFTAALLAATGIGLFELKSKLITLRRNIFIYGTPNDILYMYTRAKEKNENSITWGKYALATMLSIKPIIKFNFGESQAISKAKGLDASIEKILEHIKTKITEGLLLKAVVISFSGDLNDIKSMLAYNRFRDYAKQQQIEIVLCKMSLTVAINLGENAFMAAYCADTSEFSD
jgi:DegV family protein with EDD domain